MATGEFVNIIEVGENVSQLKYNSMATKYNRMHMVGNIVTINNKSFYYYLYT